MESQDIVTLRQELNGELGERATLYWKYYKDWFRGKLSREEFDSGCRNLLTTAEMNRMHNQFAALLIRRLQGAATSIQIDHSLPNLNKSLNARGKGRSMTASKRKYTDSTDTQDNTRSEVLYKRESSYLDTDLLTERYAAQELFLPDKAMIMGRIILTSWNYDLEGTATKNSVVDYISTATKFLLKNIITAIIQRRTTFKRFDHHFQYDYGCDVPDTSSSHSKQLTDPWNDQYISSIDKPLPCIRIKQPYERAERELAYSVACAPYEPKEEKPIRIRELYETLKANSNLIPHRVVYELTLERLITAIDESD